MEVELVDSYEEFCRIQNSWDRIHVLDAEADYFLSWRWLSEVFRANPGRWRILAVRESNSRSDYVCFLPLHLSTRWSQSQSQLETEIEAAGRLSWAQYEGFVCLPGMEEPAITALANAIQRSPWGYFSMRNCSASARRMDIFLKEFHADDYEITWGDSFLKDGSVDNLICPFVALPDDYETWLQNSLSSNTRQKIRRFWRRLEESQEMKISVTTSEEFTNHLRQMLQLWLQKWEPVRGPEDAQFTAEKYMEILSQSHACDAMFLPVLWQGNRMAGALATIVDREKKTMYFIAAGRDEQSSDPSIGLLLHAFSIRWAIDNQIKVYDFCHGSESYKYSLGAIDRRIQRLEIRRRSHAQTGRFDSFCLGQALDRIVKYMKTDRLDEAILACQHLRKLCR